MQAVPSTIFPLILLITHPPWHDILTIITYLPIKDLQPASKWENGPNRDHLYRTTKHRE